MTMHAHTNQSALDATIIANPTVSMSGGYVSRSGTTLVFAPDKSNMMWAYTNNAWAPIAIPDAGASVACTGLTANTPYYLYGYNNAGTLALDLSTTGPTTQNGIAVKTGVVDRLMLARLYAEAAGNIVDYATDASTHLINNVYNKRRIILRKTEDETNNWTYDSATWRAMNNDTTNVVRFVADGANFVRGKNSTEVQTSSDNYGLAGICLDASNANHGYPVLPYGFAVSSFARSIAEYLGIPSAGYHYLQATEACSGATGNAVTFYGQSFSVLFAEIFA